jgi:hypothetical protein
LAQGQGHGQHASEMRKTEQVVVVAAVAAGGQATEDRVGRLSREKVVVSSLPKTKKTPNSRERTSTLSRFPLTKTKPRPPRAHHGPPPYQCE